MFGPLSAIDTCQDGNSVKNVCHFLKKHLLYTDRGSNFFPYRVDPFLEFGLCAEKQTGSKKKSCLPCEKWRLNRHAYIHSPLNAYVKVSTRGFSTQGGFSTLPQEGCMYSTCNDIYFHFGFNCI